MLKFVRLTPEFAVAPQIEPEDVAEAAAEGFGFIVNNRPDAEAPDQPAGARIEAAALAAGMGYLAVPIDQSGFSPEQVAALQALMVSPRPILAFCRSGTRSTMLWSLAEAARGRPVAEIVETAAGAGYDVRALKPAMESLGGRA